MPIDNPANLSEVLSNKLDKLNNTNPAWVLFVQDHIDYVKTNSSIVEITDEIRDRYRYKFEHFLRDNKCNQSIIWIAKLLNNVAMFEHFITRDFILIPNINYINNLYRLYRTSINES